MMNTLTKVLPFLFLLLSASVFSAEAYQDQKVVYHINYDDPTRISATFSNIANHINQLGEDHITVKAVIHGPAIKYFIEASHDDAKQIALDSLRLNNVQFIICRNSLEGFHVTREDLYEVEADDVVQAGLPEIVHLQQQGYFYVRP
ncbi:DsrE family protein [Neptuniibacter pectenicola]|jgi:intracellular sulfur oxidation DsrE/DsrF family protein|uniref:DsrE family protein n=1 Tax=Neptuniibacter pectenicola TaxID=1806669 RepID=UPI00082A1B25|nr:DsrE family protein [Neptuniibacter pectenicola]